MARNAILLAGGTGSRLFPLTHVVNKHLLGVNGQFIIDYPLNTLKQLNIENLAIVLGGNHFEQVVNYIKDGEDWGFNVNYCYQPKPLGIAQAINLCKRYVQDSSDFTVLLGDNVFENKITWNNPDYKTNPRAQIVLSGHPNLQRFGVASLDGHGKIVKIEEKPQSLDNRFTNLAVAGCYLFTQEYFDFFKELKPSQRCEFEITDIIRKYIEKDNLTYTINHGLWSDAGTHDSIAFVNNYFYTKNK